MSWLRFLGFDLGAPTPDRNTIWTFRERLIRAGAMEALFATFDRELRRAGYLAMGGQIVDATLVSAPKQRNTEGHASAVDGEDRSTPACVNCSRYSHTVLASGTRSSRPTPGTS